MNRIEAEFTNYSQYYNENFVSSILLLLEFKLEIYTKVNRMHTDVVSLNTSLEH